MKFKNYKEDIEVPEGIEVKVASNTVTVKGPLGELTKTFPSLSVVISCDGHNVILLSKVATRREKRMIGTYMSHIKNMIKGVQEKFVYELKVCSGHFPMNVALKGKTLSINNFLGEKVPRVITVKDGADVNVDGASITVESIDKDIAGQVAADIENLTRITNRDRRVFQDGCWIVKKAGKVMR